MTGVMCVFHESISARERDRLGLPEDLVRRSMVIEDTDDPVADPERALTQE